MISKSQISFVKSLHQKKIRKEYGLFIVEGIKSVTDFIHSDYTIDAIFCTANLIPKLVNLSQKVKLNEITDAELKKISTLSTPQQILAIIKFPVETSINSEILNNTFTIVLDGIQDPGNLGTIIRTADWFGFKQIICSEDTVEAYNPKTVQATMGSLSRIKVSYTNLSAFLEYVKIPVYGALLSGQSIYNTDFKNEGLIVLGNEGNGISEAVLKYIKQPITIPRFGAAESLNVAISAAIFCSEIKRNILN